MSNFRNLGLAYHSFADEHDRWMPAAMSGPWGAPHWSDTMYLYHYFQLVDDYGVSPELFACPSNLPSNGPSAAVRFHWGSWDEATARSEAEDLGTIHASNLAVTGGDPTYISFHWSQAAGGGGVINHFAQTGSYTYMGGNRQYDTRSTPLAIDKPENGFWVMSIDRDTKTGTGDDDNPPIMNDATWSRPTLGNFYFNHGQSWTIGGFDATSGEADSHIGGVGCNVLYRDGHVDFKRPDLKAYAIYGGGAYFFR